MKKDDDDTTPSYMNIDPMTTDYQLFPELLGVGNLVSHIRCNSASRVQMINSHIGQALVVKGSEPRRQLTGTEREFGKYTFSKKFKRNSSIITVVDRYRKTMGVDSIAESPERIYIYEDDATKGVDILQVPRFHCLHQHFGFEYKVNRKVEIGLFPKATVAAGTILADSPAVDMNGNYGYGVELNMALMSVPGVIEDGIIIADDVLDRLSAQGFERRQANCGKNFYFLNLYGDPSKPDEYKPFPDIGERIRDDGLLFAMRRYDAILAPVEMSQKALREPDYIYDRLVYGIAGAKVIDVVVQHDDTAKIPPTPVGMEKQMVKYHQAAIEFHTRILDEYNKLKRQHGKELPVGYAFGRMVVDALIYLNKPNRERQRASKTNRRNALDDWNVEVTFQYDMIPTIGNKLAGHHGNKGVICQIWPASCMPLDAEGNRADFIMDADSIIKRMNLGVPYEQYFNAAARDVTFKVREICGVKRDGSDAPKDRPAMPGLVYNTNAASTLAPEAIALAMEYVLGFYDIVSPWTSEILRGPNYKGNPEHHIKTILRNGIYLWMPSHNPIDYVTAVKEVNAKYPPCYGSVKYTNPLTGILHTTVSPVMIGSAYVMVLEKTGGEFSGVGSANLQHHGIPAKITKMDKHAYPGRASPVRLTGEAEVRLIAATCGGTVAADLIDQSNNPTVHKAIINSIYDAPFPSNIEKVIDRKTHPLGSGRNLLFVNHLLECAGIKFVYRKETTIPMVPFVQPEAE